MKKLSRKRRRWNIKRKGENDLLSCYMCDCKSFNKKNKRELTCRYCGTTFIPLDHIEIVLNTLGRHPYEKYGFEKEE